jgi:benzoyl-CoA reductase subunit C
MKQIYELRKSENPPITGAQAMEMVVSSQLVDKEEHNRVLAELLQELETKVSQQREQTHEPGVRLMIVGSENDDTEFIRMVESLGAIFVVDDHCTGTRYFWNEVIPQEDLLSAIAARYIDRPPCPSKDWEVRTRPDHIIKLAHEYNVQGAILVQQKFCDPHELDIPAISSALDEHNIPSYFLEFDVTIPVGQFQTRVEAFLEMLREEDLF